MIARIWNGSTRDVDADRYLTHLRRHVIPELASIDGYRGIQVLRRQQAGTTGGIAPAVAKQVGLQASHKASIIS